MFGSPHCTLLFYIIMSRTKPGQAVVVRDDILSRPQHVAGQTRSYADAEGTQLLKTTRLGPEGRLCYWRRGAYGTGPAAATGVSLSGGGSGRNRPRFS